MEGEWGGGRGCSGGRAREISLVGVVCVGAIVLSAVGGFWWWRRWRWLLVSLIYDGFLDVDGYADPGEGAELGDPPMVKQPGENVKIGLLEVFSGDDGGVGAWSEGQHVEDPRKGREAREALGEGGYGGREFSHIGVWRDDVSVSLVERWNRTRTTPVD